MAYLIKSATVIAKGSPYHKQKLDILINRGKIEKIAKRIPESGHKVITSNDLHVSIGWCDIGTNLNEPGYEQRETIDNLCQLAACSGYTTLAVFPKTNPVLQYKTEINYLKTIQQSSPVELLPIAALSKDCEGQEMTEYFDLKEAGAVAFSDGLGGKTSDGLLQRALEYLKAFDGLVIYSPSDYQLSKSGQMHEGEMSLSLGLPGIPEEAELRNVNQALNLLDYTGGSMILHAISSYKSLVKVQDAQQAKKIGLTIPYMNLAESDQTLTSFDENFKVLPPLRDEANRDELRKMLKSKQMSAIVSNHTPYEQEEKQNAFPLAAFGASSLQSTFPVLNRIKTSKLPLDLIIDKISISPRKLLKLDVPRIEEGDSANLTVFDPNITWTLNEETNQSQSKNNPYFGQEMKGKVLCVFNKNNSYFTPY